MQIQVKKLHPDAVVPSAGSAGAAGYDLHACLSGDGEISAAPGHTVKIPTGLAFALPEGYFGGVFARSGLATREGLRPANCVGVIDSDYRGELIVAIHNDSAEERHIRSGDRVAQLVLLPCLRADFCETEELSETARGAGGFGSTGK